MSFLVATCCSFSIGLGGVVASFGLVLDLIRFVLLLILYDEQCRRPPSSSKLRDPTSDDNPGSLCEKFSPATQVALVAGRQLR